MHFRIFHGLFYKTAEFSFDIFLVKDSASS